MSILVLITSAAYTLFESSSSSFKNSYDQVVSDGALHDLVIKENFKLADKDEVKVTNVQKLDGTLVNLDGQSLEANKIVVPGSKRDFVINLGAEGDYSQYGLRSQELVVPISFSMSSDIPSASDFAMKVNDVAALAKSIIEVKVKEKLKVSFIDSLNDIYSNSYNLNAKDVADFSEMSAISVESGVSAFKVIRYNKETRVNKLNVYDGTDQFIPSLTDQQMLDELNKKISLASVNGANFGTANTLKGYKITSQSAVGDVLSVYDASSYQAVVSPTFANQNNKQAISLEEFYNIVNEWPYQTDNGGMFNFFDALSNKVSKLVDTYKNNII